MPQAIAGVIFALGILWLFVLDRDREIQTSKALWLPVVYLWIAGSRAVSEWLAAIGWGAAAPLLDSVDRYFEGSPNDRLVFAALLTLGVVVLLRRGRQVETLLRANGPMLVFFLYCAISVLWSDYPFVAFKRWTKAVGDPIMILIVLTDLNPSAAIKRVLARAGFLLMPLSILFIKYYPDLGRYYSRWEGTQSFGGVTTNKNSLGMACLVLGLGALWRFLQVYRSREGTRRTKQLIAQGVVVAMVLWLLWIANSVTSLSCFALAGSLIVVTSFSALARKRAVIHLLVVVMLSAASSALFLDVGSGILETMGRNPTLTGRTEIWHLVLGLAGNPLFGTGFESFWLGPRLEKIWSIYWWHPNEAHNGYLEVFLNLGWVGVAMLAVVMVTGYRDIVSSFQRDPDAASLRLAYLVAAAAYSLTEAGFRMMSPIWIFLLLAVTATPTIRSEGRDAAACGVTDTVADIG